MSLAYAPDALEYDGETDSFALRSDFDPMRHSLDLECGGTLGHGVQDAAAWSDPSDPDIAHLRDMHGVPIHSGHAVVAQRLTLTGPDGDCVQLDLIEIDHEPVASIPSVPLSPGTRYRTRGAAPPGTEPPCIAGLVPGTPVATADGELPVELLAPGDRIVTHGHGLQSLRWIGRTRLDQRQLSARTDLLPVPLAPHSAENMPRRGLAAPATRVLLTGADVSLHFGFDAALARVGDLIGPGSPAARPGGLTYLSLLFDRHEVFCAGSVWCESLLLDAGTAAQLAGRDAAPPGDIRHAQSVLPCLADWETRLLRSLRERVGARPRSAAA